MRSNNTQFTSGSQWDLLCDGRYSSSMHRVLGILTAFLLTSCAFQGSIGEGIGKTLRTSSGTIKEAVDQAKAAVELGKLGVERAKEGIQEAQETAEEARERLRKVQEGWTKVEEGTGLLREAVSGSGRTR